MTKSDPLFKLLLQYDQRKRQLTSADAPGPKLQLPKLYDGLKDQLRGERESGDEKLASMEKRA